MVLPVVFGEPEGGRLVVKTLVERLKHYVLYLEWGWNDNDGQGPRCFQCRRPSHEGHRPASDGGCELQRLCDDIRLVARARELEPPNTTRGDTQ